MEVYLIQLEETNKKLVPLDNLSNCHCKPCQKKISQSSSDFMSTSAHQKLQ